MVKTVKDPIVTKLVKTLKSKKALNIVVMDMRETGQNVCDFFIVCHGTSSVHTQSIAENTIKELRREEALKPVHVEGLTNAEWILVDYGNVVAHIFREETRDFYKLEELWADADIKSA
jgi:ribosome-associated protein